MRRRKKKNKGKGDKKVSVTALATTPTPAPKYTYVYNAKKTCHTDPMEIYKNLWLGSFYSVKDMVTAGATVLVPLNDLMGSIWDTGWRGRILYYPIKDYHDLPLDVLNSVVEDILRELANGEKVGVFCMGGHGRTGYVAAAVLAKLIPDIDPVVYVREKYCKEAIESYDQLDSLAEYLDKPELSKHTIPKPAYPAYVGTGVAGYTAGGYVHPTQTKLCRDCMQYDNKAYKCLLDNPMYTINCPDWELPTPIEENIEQNQISKTCATCYNYDHEFDKCYFSNDFEAVTKLSSNGCPDWESIEPLCATCKSYSELLQACKWGTVSQEYQDCADYVDILDPTEGGEE